MCIRDRSKDVDRNRRDHVAKDRKARELARAENKQDESAELLKKRVTELEWQLTDLRKSNQAGAPSNPMTEKHPTESNQTRPKTIAGARDNRKSLTTRKKEPAGDVAIRIIDCGNARSCRMPKR